MEPLRLHLNELPWPPPKEVLDAARKGLEKLNRYSDEKKLQELMFKLGDYTGIASERIILSPGSDILLREAVHLFTQQRKVVTLCPSFLPTVTSARQTTNQLTRLRLSLPDFRLNMDLLKSELEGPCLLILDNPNNPTGKIVISPDEVKTLLEKEDVLLIVDEAYYEFSGITCANLVEKYPNLLVTRTMDKVFSLAGARIGFGLAGDVFLKKLSDFFIYLPQIALYACLAALDKKELMKERVNFIIEERKRLVEKLLTEGVEVYDTSANFILINSPIPEVVEELKKEGILITDLSHQMPQGFIRITIGKAEENNQFFNKFQKLRNRFGLTKKYDE